MGSLLTWSQVTGNEVKIVYWHLSILSKCIYIPGPCEIWYDIFLSVMMYSSSAGGAWNTSIHLVNVFALRSHFIIVLLTLSKTPSPLCSSYWCLEFTSAVKLSAYSYLSSFETETIIIRRRALDTSLLSKPQTSEKHTVDFLLFIFVLFSAANMSTFFEINTHIYLRIIIVYSNCVIQ